MNQFVVFGLYFEPNTSTLVSFGYMSIVMTHVIHPSSAKSYHYLRVCHKRVSMNCMLHFCILSFLVITVPRSLVFYR